MFTRSIFALSKSSLGSLLVIILCYIFQIVSAQTPAYGKQDCLYENCLPSQSGYLEGYNFDPAIVGGPSFGQQWNTVTGNEQFLSQPVTYTPPGGKQVVIAMSENNNIYVLDAATGSILTQRNVGAPFTAQDAQCPDLTPYIGITSTPVIDPATGTLYFWSKSYLDPSGATTGLNNGRYHFYGVDAITLQDKFTPYDPQGLQPTNNLNQAFEGGKQLQRTGLVLIDGVIYAGFGGHCDNFNYTGYIIGTDAATGKIVNSFSTQSGPSAGTGSGVWQAGGALAYDGKYIFFVTGNGFGEELTTPRIGSSPPGALAMAVTKLAINPANKALTAIDFFVPSDYRSIDAADQDFGSSGVCLLPVGFSQGSVRKLAIANGKNSKAYIMNADNLGGYKTGANSGDGNLQTIALGGQTFATAGGYPYEGGYIYLSAVGSPTIALKLGADANGGPVFSQVGQTADVAPAIRGTGHTTVTSNNGQPGTGLVWITDTQNGNVRVYPAVPPSSGPWNHIFSAQLPRGGIKYGRVTPGGGRMFVTSTSGTITAFGSPVNQPFNCTSGLDFGSTIIGNLSTVQINCVPNIATQINSISVSNNSVSIVGAPQLPTNQLVANGATISFNATWKPTWAGTFVFSVTLNTTNAQSGFVTSQPVSILGKAVSSIPLLSFSPTNIAFGGLTPGNNLTVGGVNKTVIIGNNGLQDLRIITWDFDEFYDLEDDEDEDSEDHDDDDDDDEGTDTDGVLDKKTTTGNFTMYGMPSVVPALSSVSLIINYNPTVYGDFTGNLTILTDGGQGTTIITGTAASSGEMHYLTEQYGGNYLNDTPYMDFGIVNALPTSFAPSQVQYLIVNNTGGSALQLTKSKPPTGPIILAQNPSYDLTEGQYIPPYNSSSAAVLVQPPVLQVNTPAYNVSGQWVLNANGDNAGVQFVQMSARIVSTQVGPMLNSSSFGDANGTARYAYLGCFPEVNNGGRTFANSANVPSSTMTTASCLTAAAAANGPGNFVATEYGQECWLRATPPITPKVSDENCNMLCNNDPTHFCGAAGFMSVYYDTLAYNATSAQFLPGAYQGILEVPSTGNWTSLSCITEGKGGRALVGPTTSSNSMTVEMCTAYCQTQKQTYAGIEYGGECYCGNVVSNGASFNATGCNMQCRGSNRELCGGPSRLNLYIYNGTYTGTTTSSSALSTPTTASATTTQSTTTTNTQPSTPVTQPSPSFVHPANYKGCFKEPGGPRALPNAVTVSNPTNEACFAACSAAGYSVSGNQYGTECWCGNAFSYGTTVAPETDCNMACPGNSTEACGAGNRLSVYSALSNVPVQALPSLPQTVGSYSLQGCWSDNQGNGRTLSALVPNLGKNNSLEACANACSSYNYFGTEYGTECYCDNVLNPKATNQSISDCNMACPANSTEYCGAGNRLSLYKLTPVSISSSTTITATISSTTTTTSSSITSSLTTSSTSSISSTSSTTSSTSTTSMTSTVSSTSSTVTPTSTTTSSTTSISTTTSTSSTSTSSSSSSVSTTTSSTSPISTALPTGISSLGCYQDVGNRTLSFNAFSNSSNTPTFCATQCRQLGYRYAGVEYGNQCWCDNFILNAGSTTGSGQTGCTAACAGDKTQKCGGSNRIQIYKDENWQQSLFTVQAFNKWTYTDCLIDKPPPRTLNVTLPSSNAQTAESCLQQCQSKNLPYCGLEYGNQCYGGWLTANNLTTLSAPNQGSNDPLARGCNMACKGNSTEACGGANRILVYMFNANANAVTPATVQRIGS